MARLVHHLGSKVFRRAAERSGLLIFSKHLGQTIINDLDVAILVTQNVLKLEVAMDDALHVEVADGYGHLSCIEEYLLFLEALLCLKDFIHFSSSHKRHDEVQPEVVLEEELHANQERMVALKHDIFLENGVINLIVLYQNVFPDTLASIQHLGLLVLTQEHFSESTTTNHHQEVEVLKTYRLLIVFILLSHELCASQL